MLRLTGWRQRPAATVAVPHEERGGRSNCWPLHLQSVRPYQFGRNPILPLRNPRQSRMPTARKRLREARACRIINWIAVRRTGTVCVARRTGVTTFETHSRGLGSDDHSGTSPSAQNYVVRMRCSFHTSLSYSHWYRICRALHTLLPHPHMASECPSNRNNKRILILIIVIRGNHARRARKASGVSI